MVYILHITYVRTSSHFSKAFDRAPHKYICMKLVYVLGPTLQWIENSLSDRMQQVTIVDSCLQSVTSVAPQGMVLALLLYLFYLKCVE